MSQWKKAEVQVAKILGGRRRIRVQYSESVEDVSHPNFAVEVKYGKCIPRWVKVKEPTMYVFYDPYETLVLFPLSAASVIACDIKKRKTNKFILDGLSQASGYNPLKIPLLCMKPRGFRGIIGCVFWKDYLTTRLILNPGQGTV